MCKKYEMTDEVIDLIGFGNKLHRIKALRDFGDVKAGDLGGWIEKEENLSHEGNAWVYDTAQVFDNAMVYGNARVGVTTRISGNAQVYGNAVVSNGSWVHDDAKVFGNAIVSNNTEVSGNAKVAGVACIWNCTIVSGNVVFNSDIDFISCSNVDSNTKVTTFFRCMDEVIQVNWGCFHGTLNEFIAKVKEKHGNTKLGKYYLMLADLIEDYKLIGINN